MLVWAKAMARSFSQSRQSVCHNRRQRRIMLKDQPFCNGADKLGAGRPLDGPDHRLPKHRMMPALHFLA